jgi:hypothetical protein
VAQADKKIIVFPARKIPGQSTAATSQEIERFFVFAQHKRLGKFAVSQYLIAQELETPCQFASPAVTRYEAQVAQVTNCLGLSVDKHPSLTHGKDCVQSRFLFLPQDEHLGFFALHRRAMEKIRSPILVYPNGALHRRIGEDLAKVGVVRRFGSLEW